MISLPKEKTWKWLGHFFLLTTGLAVLFGSLVLTGFETMASDKNIEELRNVPIEYVEELTDGEKITRTYNVPESNVGPESIKYPIKKIRDNIWINLSKNPKDKSEVCLLIADKRMFETVELVKNRKDEELIFKTLSEAFTNLKMAKESLSHEDKNKVEISRMNQQINQAGLAYEDIVKSFNYTNDEITKIIDELETWNQKNNEEKRKD